MRQRHYIPGLLLLLLLIGTAAIQRYSPTPLSFTVPPGFPQPNQKLFQHNPLSEEAFQLGRVLFYDGKLSKDGVTSCGSCHQQFAAFATLDHDVSHGIFDSLTRRNAPALFNLAWQSSWHWDGGVNHLEVQPLTPFTASNEMGMTLDTILQIINADTMYQRMYYEAFGDAKATSQRTFKALSQFMLMMISANSKYDRVMAGKDKFSNYEHDGYQLYKTHCSSCHPEPLFTDFSFRNNGMSLNYYNDIGRMLITGKAEDSLSFKVPTLRNTQVSFPYMHDGSLAHLPNVLDHYNRVSAAPPAGLDSLLQKPMLLSERDKMVLLTFLYTLTDSAALRNPRFAPTPNFTFKH